MDEIRDAKSKTAGNCAPLPWKYEANWNSDIGPTSSGQPRNARHTLGTRLGQAYLFLNNNVNLLLISFYNCGWCCDADCMCQLGRVQFRDLIANTRCARYWRGMRCMLVQPVIGYDRQLDQHAPPLTVNACAMCILRKGLMCPLQNHRYPCGSENV